MKIIVTCLFLIIAEVLFSQVSFILEGTINKLSPDDEIIDIWLDDLNDDGIDEIYASYRYFDEVENENIWKLAIHNLNGELINTLIQHKPENEILYKCTTYKNGENNYLITASCINQGDYSFLDVEIYDFDTFTIIDTVVYNIGEDYIFYDVFCIKPVIIQGIVTINIGIGRRTNYITLTRNKSILFKFYFDDDILQLMGINQHCGTSLHKFDGCDFLITTGKYYFSDNDPMYPYWGIAFYLKQLTMQNPTTVTDIYQVNFNTFSSCNNIILNINDENYSDCGLAINYSDIYIEDEYPDHWFVTFLPDLSDTLWTSDFTNIGESHISTSTCVSIENQDQFMMYFSNNQLEIRNRISGEIIHYQDSPILPISIERQISGNLLFFAENYDETGYDYYSVIVDLDVQTNETGIVSNEYDLYNYPNPFNPVTTIDFFIQKESEIRIIVYNIRGQIVKTIIQDNFDKGKHSVFWNGLNDSGEHASSGIYYISLIVNNQTKVTRKCVLLE